MEQIGERYESVDGGFAGESYTAKRDRRYTTLECANEEETSHFAGTMEHEKYLIGDGLVHKLWNVKCVTLMMI